MKEHTDTIDTIIAKYGQKVPKKPRKSRTIILSVVIAAAMLGALVLFKKPMTTHTNTTTSAQVFNGPEPTQVVDKISADPTVSDAKNYFVSRTTAAHTDPSSDSNSIIYNEKGYDFVTNTGAEDGLRFTLKDTKSVSNKAAITTAIQTTLVAAGFTKVTQDIGALSVYTAQTYVNDGTVCQTVDFTGAKQGILEQGVLCSSHAGIETAYKNVQTLLAKVDATTVTNAKAVGQTSVKDGAKILQTLTVQPKSGTATRYFFATTGTDYEYIGNQPTPSVDIQSSYSLSDQLKKNIADPKWGTFLSDTIK